MFTVVPRTGSAVPASGHMILDYDSIEVLFAARTELEEAFDFLYVYSEQDQLGDSHKDTGAALAGQTICIAEDTIKI